jgi:ferredoxin--NADP+ reductase
VENNEFGNQFHHRLYSIADLPKTNNKKPNIKILVKRCNFIDEYNGEIYKGIASHYLCDRVKNDDITITGPFGLPFTIPENKSADLLLIGLGTGIAPFRALIKHIYTNIKDWSGRVRLFYGARTGLELIYMNDKNDDLIQYYDETTFKAFQALSPRPHWADPIALDYALEERAEEIMNILGKPDTHVFVAGYEQIRKMLDKAFTNIFGSEDKWFLRKAELEAGKRWVEVVY